MNREYLLDSLDGFKSLLFRLLPASVSGSVACIPMTTDDPWTDAEKAVFEAAIGIPSERTYWQPGGFVKVPPSTDLIAWTKWVDAIAAINHRYLFLDPDTGFYTHHNGRSEKKVLIAELASMLRSHDALIVYRHQYWPTSGVDGRPDHVYRYVWHGLRILRAQRLAAFAYQSQAASFFFVSGQEAGLEPFRLGLELAFNGVSAAVKGKRLVIRKTSGAGRRARG